MLTGHVDELVWTLAIGITYLLVVRLLDLNEREPLWSLCVVFLLGGAAGTLLRIAVASPILDLTVLTSAALKEGATFVAIACGMAILAAVGRLRGWNEVTDLVDGVVYGIAGGLGFACGDMLARWVSATPSVGFSALATPFAMVSGSALKGFAQGVFGGVIGSGFGAAIGMRSRVQRAGIVVVALIAAVCADAAHQMLAYGNALGGSAGVIRAWTALLLPLLMVGAIAVHGLMTGQKAIQRHLTDEADAGVVTPAELALLRNIPQRQLTYVSALASLRFRRLSCLTSLHNRQVMLALAKLRESGEPDAARRAAARQEVDTLRARVVEARLRLDRTVRARGIDSRKTGTE